MDRNLLKEAIADAKAIRESAIANAKAALEEAFTPHLKDMLAQRINEMEEEVDEGKDEKSKEMEEGYYGEDMTEEMEKDMKEMMHDKDMTEEKDEDMKEAMRDKDMSEEMEKDMKEGYGKKPMSEEDKMDEAKEEVEEEINLEELLSEMDAEMKEEEKMEEEKKEVMEAEEEETESEEESVEIEDMTEDELTKFVEEVIKDMVEAGELEAGEKMDMDMDMDMEVEDEEETMEMEEAKEMDENSTTDSKYQKSGFAEEMKAKSNKSEMEEGSYKYEMEETMKEKDAELKEAYETVKTLRKEINEVNLLNSKLLYTNKIFRNRNLNESQKIKVLNSFDKASNVKEVKLVFESLSTTLESKKSNIKESMGFASKPAGKAPITESKEVIHEDAMVARFKKLAGL